MQILVVEDDKRISDFLVEGLKKNDFQVTLKESAEEALNFQGIDAIDLMIIDIMLPGKDGIALVRELRTKKNSTPILVLSALSEVSDKIKALDFGADDYLTKPFHFEELLSRINALSRRNNHLQIQNEDNHIKLGALEIDKEQFRVHINKKLVELSPKEFQLLLFLVEHKNKVVTRVQLLESVWGINFDNQTNVVDVYISYLRNKIEFDGLKFIHTVKGFGYSLRELEDEN